MNIASSAVPTTAGIRNGPHKVGSTMKPAIAYSNRMSPFQMRTQMGGADEHEECQPPDEQ